MTSAASTAPLEAAFREHRRALWDFCYRLTGVAADADDIVQETFARAARDQPSTERSLGPWLMRVAANLGRDVLRTRKRRGYTGPWLPSPIATPEAESVETAVEGAEARYDRLESVSFAFLLALEVLTPTQRAVLLLRDVFDYSVREASDVLDLSEGAVKTAHHRARVALEAYDRTRAPRTAVTRERHMLALGQLLDALERGDEQSLRRLFSSEVVLRTDGGGEYVAALNPIRGPDDVAAFLLGVKKKIRREWRMSFCMLNGQPAVVAELAGPDLSHPRYAPRFALLSEPAPSGGIATVHIVLAPRKLSAPSLLGDAHSGPPHEPAEIVHSSRSRA